MFPVVYQQNGVLARTDDIGGRNAGKKFRYIFKDFFLFFTACQKDYSRCKQDCRCHHGFEQISHNYPAKTAAGMATIHMAWPTTFGTRSVLPAPSAWETMAPPAEEMAWLTTPIIYPDLELSFRLRWEVDENVNNEDNNDRLGNSTSVQE